MANSSSRKGGQNFDLTQLAVEWKPIDPDGNKKPVGKPIGKK
jgi:hypothetical protein